VIFIRRIENDAPDFLYKTWTGERIFIFYSNKIHFLSVLDCYFQNDGI